MNTEYIYCKRGIKTNVEIRLRKSNANKGYSFVLQYVYFTFRMHIFAHNKKNDTSNK